MAPAACWHAPRCCCSTRISRCATRTACAALVCTLCRDNPAAFHRADAAGYVFWAERLLELDAVNPSLAGRLARVMDRWSHLAEPYRSAAREAIARVAARSELSDEVREIVSRALESA